MKGLTLAADGFTWSGSWEGFGAMYVEEGNKGVYLGICITAFVLLFALIAFLSFSKKDKKTSAIEISIAAVCIALSSVLSVIRLWRGPEGGSVTPGSMVPIAIFAYIFGLRKGILVCFTYGVLQVLLGGYIINPVQMLLDYPIPYAMIGLVGLASKSKKPIVGILTFFPVARVARYIVHVLSGVIFFGGDWGYSFFYNTVVLVDGIIAIVITALLFANKNFAFTVKKYVGEC